ncbi:MAG: hypothetical protein WB677_11015 [Xanthobacteraceae bacterium]
MLPAAAIGLVPIGPRNIDQHRNGRQNLVFFRCGIGLFLFARRQGSDALRFLGARPFQTELIEVIHKRINGPLILFPTPWTFPARHFREHLSELPPRI